MYTWCEVRNFASQKFRLTQGNRSQLWQDSAFFFQTRIWNRSQYFLNSWSRIRSYFSFSVITGVCVVFRNVISYVKTLLNFGCIDGSPNRSRIFKFGKFLSSDSNILAQERNWSLKMWLRPPRMGGQDRIRLTISKKFADRDWIGINFLRSGLTLDSDWNISQSAFLCALQSAFHTHWRNRVNI